MQTMPIQTNKVSVRDFHSHDGNNFLYKTLVECLMLSQNSFDTCLSKHITEMCG